MKMGMETEIDYPYKVFEDGEACTTSYEMYRNRNVLSNECPTPEFGVPHRGTRYERPSKFLNSECYIGERGTYERK